MVEYCNCDPSFLPQAIETKCYTCGYCTIIDEDELDETGSYLCDECSNHGFDF